MKNGSKRLPQEVSSEEDSAVVGAEKTLRIVPLVGFDLRSSGRQSHSDQTWSNGFGQPRLMDNKKTNKIKN